MSQQYPQEPGYGYPQQQQPPTQWGAPHQQPQPGWGAPPPQPPKKSSTGKTIGIVVAGVFGLLVIIGIFGAALSDGGSDDSSKGSTVSAEPTPTDDPAAEDPAAEVEEEPTEEPAPESPVKVTAKNTPFAKSILAADSNYTSVLVTITNNGDEPIDVNPLHFTITDTKGTKHTAELAADENQIDTVDLAPGENVSGTVTGKGKFTAKYVTYTDGFLGESLRADVS